MRCAQQPRGLPPWARAGLVSLSSGWSAHLSPKTWAPHSASEGEFEKRGHAGTADHHMRAGGIQERKDQLYAGCHAVSSRVLEKFAIVRYNRETSPRIPPGSLAETRWSSHDVCMTGGRDPVIRTPDQRIRVFVSSTLQELAEER